MRRSLLVVDDTEHNLRAAQKFFERKHVDVTYVATASEGLEHIASVDAVITDLFFRDREEQLHQRYLDLIEQLPAVMKGIEAKVSADDWQYRLRDYYRDELEGVRGREPHPYNQTLLRNGLENQQQFAYGLLMMLEAKRLGKNSVLLTSLHRHAQRTQPDPVFKIDGAVVLAPLISEGIVLPLDAVRNSGAHYVGDDIDKTRAMQWKKAYDKILYQQKKETVKNAPSI